MGSVEQHGPHLPTGTDSFAATAIALEVAERLDALVLPLCPLGVTPMHMPYPGTVSLRPGTLQSGHRHRLVAAAHGGREFVILNWHEGNIPTLALAAERLHREIGLAVVVVQACYVAEERFGPQAGGLTHGGNRDLVGAVLPPRPRGLDRAEGGGDRQRGELPTSSPRPPVHAGAHRRGPCRSPAGMAIRGRDSGRGEGFRCGDGTEIAARWTRAPGARHGTASQPGSP